MPSAKNPTRFRQTDRTYYIYAGAAANHGVTMLYGASNRRRLPVRFDPAYFSLSLEILSRNSAAKALHCWADAVPV
jgi:hypothetical protein